MGRDFYIRVRLLAVRLQSLLLSLSSDWYCCVCARLQALVILSEKFEMFYYRLVLRSSQAVAATGRPKSAEAEPFLWTSCDNKVLSVWVCMAIRWWLQYKCVQYVCACRGRVVSFCVKVFMCAGDLWRVSVFNSYAVYILSYTIEKCYGWTNACAVGLCGPRLTKTEVDLVAKLRPRVQHSTKPGREEAAIVCSSLSHSARAADWSTICRIRKARQKRNLYLSHSLRP